MGRNIMNKPKIFLIALALVAMVFVGMNWSIEENVNTIVDLGVINFEPECDAEPEIEHLENLRYWDDRKGLIIEEDIIPDAIPFDTIWFGDGDKPSIIIRVKDISRHGKGVEIWVDPSLSKEDIVKIMFKSGHPEHYKQIYGD